MSLARFTVDVGNSSVGVARWDGRPTECLRTADPREAATLLSARLAKAHTNRAPAPEIVLVSVSPLRSQRFLESLDPSLTPLLRLLTQPPSSLGIPELLGSAGADRVANALAVSPGPAVIVDAGTAVTVDVVDKEGRFRGGFIAAGPTALSRGLATATALLPELEPRLTRDLLPGTNTRDALSGGVGGMILGGVDRLVQRALDFLRAEPGVLNPKVFATGGWGALWASQSGFEQVEVDEWLVHRGIARWAGWN
ncbi:MAG: type III pantothenate kinase [Planctomycetota bacterium]